LPPSTFHFLYALVGGGVRLATAERENAENTGRRPRRIQLSESHELCVLALAAEMFDAVFREVNDVSRVHGLFLSLTSSEYAETGPAPNDLGFSKRKDFEQIFGLK
jgi:hypothetical protein